MKEKKPKHICITENATKEMKPTKASDVKSFICFVWRSTFQWVCVDSVQPYMTR